jgi:hypothetical protein
VDAREIRSTPKDQRKREELRKIEHLDEKISNVA